MHSSHFVHFRIIHSTEDCLVVKGFIHSLALEPPLILRRFLLQCMPTCAQMMTFSSVISSLSKR